jgi:putative transposase
LGEEVAMMLNILMNWRATVWVAFLLFLAVCSFLPQGELLLASWWAAQKDKGPVCWRVTRQAVGYPQWWPCVRRLYRWGWAGLWVGLSLWLLRFLLIDPAPPCWAWLCLIALSHVGVGAVQRVLPEQVRARPAPISGTSPDIELTEVTIDLEPILTELGDLSPTKETSCTEREALTARFERIRAECFRHPAAHALLEQIDAQVRQLLKRLLEEALEQELDEYLGFGRYERTGVAKPTRQHRSGSWSRSLRTMWGCLQVRVPKLRCGNRERLWQVLERYERSFGSWLDVQLALYVLGLSQGDLQEILYLAFGQALSRKAIEHLTDTVQKEREAFRQARLEDTPPAMIVDGVNIKVLCPTGTYRTDQRGHCRQVKRREARVILAAVGLWPDPRRQVLYFETVEQETKAHWKKFFRHLMAKGLDTSQLQLVVSDGRPGLHTAIRSVFPKTVKHQRCIFHKLKNLADNLTYNDLALNLGLPYREACKQAKEARARAILQEAAHIYAGSDIETIKRRLAEFQRKWASLEPKAVRCFVKDFDLTLNYLRVPFPHKHLIRTTNLLERFFREFRSRADEIGCFGSQAQAETLFYLILQRDKAKHAVA